ncbi:MAG: AmmeMemoRadiSam system protein B [Candidatus Micrarchaeota archaeon]
MGMNVRKAAVANSFYPGGKDELEAQIKKFISDSGEVQFEGRLAALVEPHAGYVYSGPTAACGYKLLQSHKKGIKKILLLGPSHYAGFYGACESGFDEWETPLGNIKTETVADKVDRKYRDLFPTIPEAHIPEHCLEVQLPFLQIAMKKDFRIIPLLLGEVDCGALANALLPLIDASTLVIASSDLSHYHSYNDAIRMDAIANESVPNLDIPHFEKSGDACGKKPILTLMHLALQSRWKGRFLDYRNSGDTAGPKGQVVGYGCYAFGKGRLKRK